MLTIRQTETGWELLRDGVVLTVAAPDGGETSTFARYEDAVAVIARMIEQSALAVVEVDTETETTSEDGLLPEAWESPSDGGICFSDATGDGRDFTNCAWTWRDPSVSVVPLMLQTETDFGHFGAALAGYVTEFVDNSGTPGATGRFYNSETGIAFRDMLLDGRRFGVSVDPGAVAWEDECLQLDEDGWCEQYQMNFLAYEIIGITGTPFPGFAEAAIQLAAVAPVTASAGHPCGCETETCACSTRDSGVLSTRATSPFRISDSTRNGRNHDTVGPDGRSVVAAAAVATIDVPLAPPRSWFPDRHEGPGFLMPTPLTITNQGRVLGHVAVWNTCHTGHLDRCVTPPRGSDLQDFLQGRVFTETGEEVRTGVLTWQADHPDHALTFAQASALYADSLAGWADVVAGEDQFGPWVSGALRPGLTAVDVRILRALSLSGDWRVSRRTGRHELIGVIAVNYPGFPISAGAREMNVAAPRPFSSPQVITAAGMVPQSARKNDDFAARLAIVEARQARHARGVLAQMKADERGRALARLRG